MSHFTVMVIGDDVDYQLAPFHEYECTGREDEFVIDVDITDQVQEQFNKPINVVVLNNGTMHDRYDNKFYTKISGDELSRRLNENEFELPAGAEIKTVPAEEARMHKVGYLTMGECAKDYFGGFARDGKFYNRTNPQKKWDWYSIGGRWTGYFKLKTGHCGTTGKPGLMTDRPKAGFVDSCTKDAIDFGAMRDEKGKEAAELWDKVYAVRSGETWESWEAIRERVSPVETARDAYWNQPAIRKIKEAKIEELSWKIDDALAGSREAYEQAARDRVCVPYALVKDRQWYGRGDMGWWGMSSNETDQAEWNRKVTELLDTLPGDTLLTIVDCHI